MKELKKKVLENKYSSLAIILLGLIAVWYIFNTNLWDKKKKVIYYDPLEYYSYLPAAFIHNDVSLSFMKDYKGDLELLFWPKTTPDGKKVIKMSMGVSILYSPWFFVGHGLAKLTGASPSGFSKPYKVALVFGSLFYFFIGMFVLQKLLRMRFSDLVTTLTIIMVVAGTNLYHYAYNELTMSHLYNFMLFLVFLLLTIRWHEKATYSRTIFIGLLAGLITLIRPVNILIVFIFVLYDIKSRNDFTNKFKYYLDHWKHIMIIAIFAFLIWIPQLAYWKHVTGQWFYYSYMDESFYFLKPHIIEGLFGFRKGWFTYTPIMLLAIIGIVTLRKKAPELFIPYIIFFVLFIYITLSWWCWWYGGSLGNRPFIDTYGLLAIPLAAALERVLSYRALKKGILVIIFACFTIIGIKHNVQYHYFAIHWDSMTRAAYFDSFFRIRSSAKFNDLLKAPDYKSARKGKKEQN